MTITVTDHDAIAVSDLAGRQLRRKRATLPRLRVFAWLWRSIQAGRSRRVLRSLPDYILKDIGIRRCEIDLIATQLFDDPDAEPRRSPRNLAYGRKVHTMSSIAKVTGPQRPKMIVPRLSPRRRNGIATGNAIVTAAVLTAAAVSVLLVMPILAAKQTSVVRDVPASTEILELMKRVKDLPVQEIDGLI